MSPFQILSEEHKPIVSVFELVDKMHRRGYKEVDDLRSIVEFFQIFADKYHYGKEEYLLFPAMIEAGANENKINDLKKRHQECRKFITVMANEVEESVNGNHRALDNFYEILKEYELFLLINFETEGALVFPEGEKILTQEKKDHLVKEFNRVHEEELGIVKYKELKESIEYLEDKYI